MAVTAQANGTQTATVGTEHTLADVGISGTFTLHVDSDVMVAGDILELRIYQMVLTGGTRRVAYYQAYYDSQIPDDKIKISVPISNELSDSGALRFTLKQAAGVSRNFPWKILKYA